MKDIISEFWNGNRRFLQAFLIIWGCLLAFDLVYPKEDVHMMLNAWHSPFLDFLFKYVTKLGEGFPVYLGLVVLIWSRRNGLFILLSQGLTFIFTQILKYLFSHPRPATYFEQIGRELPQTVEGVGLRRAMNSFPSGHTSAAFALFTCLILITPKSWRWLWLILAWLAAYSRIYLSQHFLEDILLGSVIGVASTCAMYMIMESFVSRKKKSPIN